MKLLRIGLKALFPSFFFLSFFMGIFFSGQAALFAASDSLSFATSWVSTRPKMVFVDPPGIFYAPDSPYNLYRIEGTWYYYYDEKWYRSDRHDGSWRYLSPSKVPDLLKSLPERYIKKENGPLQADADSPKRKKGKNLRSKKKVKSSPGKISSPRPLSS